MASAAQATRREQLRTVNEQLSELRQQLRTARAVLKVALAQAKEHCKAERLAVQEHAKALRAQFREQLRVALKAEQDRARQVCAVSREDARALASDVERARAALQAAEQLKRDLLAAEKAHLDRRRAAPPITGEGDKVESDDDVRQHLSPMVAPLFEKVKRSIKPAPNTSRTEAFLAYAERHPAEVLAASKHPVHEEVNRLEQEHAKLEKRANPYEEKKAARVERMKGRAEHLSSAADSAYAGVRRIGDMIPMGQPILVGHHSEKRHRRDIERMDRGMRKHVELKKQAADLQRRAERAEVSTAVSSDDPEAVEKLRAKLQVLDESRARMVLANKLIRTSKDPKAALIEAGFRAADAVNLLTPDVMKRIGFADYALSNASQESARLRKRIEELEARASKPATPTLELPGGVRIEEAENRVRIFFGGKPEEAMRTALKGAGFKWAPSIGAWQRHASTGAWHEAKRVLGVGDHAPSASKHGDSTGAEFTLPLPPVMFHDSLFQKPENQTHDKLGTKEAEALVRLDIDAEVRAGRLPRAVYKVSSFESAHGPTISIEVSELEHGSLRPFVERVRTGANLKPIDEESDPYTTAANELQTQLSKLIGRHKSQHLPGWFRRATSIEPGKSEPERLEALKRAMGTAVPARTPIGRGRTAKAAPAKAAGKLAKPRGLGPRNVAKMLRRNIAAEQRAGRLPKATVTVRPEGREVRISVSGIEGKGGWTAAEVERRLDALLSPFRTELYAGLSLAVSVGAQASTTPVKEAKSPPSNVVPIRPGTATATATPETVAVLRARLAELSQKHERMVATNAALTSPHPHAALRALGYSDVAMRSLMAMRPNGKVGFAEGDILDVERYCKSLRKQLLELGVPEVAIPTIVVRPTPVAPKVKGEGLDTAQVAALIRQDIKAAQKIGQLPPTAKISVTTDRYSMGSSITIVVTNLPFLVVNRAAYKVERGLRRMDYDHTKHESIFTAEALAVEKRINTIMNAYHWDKSDSSTDYYNERFARHVRIESGKREWEKVQEALVAEAREEEKGN